MSGTPSLTGRFAAHQLMTVDPERAARFYGELFSEWDIGRVSASGDTVGFRIRVNGNEVGGISMLQDVEGLASHWVGSVVVDDCEAASEMAVQAGGLMVVPVISVPMVGSQGTIRDANGATLNLIEPARSISIPDLPVAGECGGNELQTSQPRDAQRFYPSVVGWSVVEISAGGHDTQTLFRSGEVDVAWVSMIDGDSHVKSRWLTYWCVDDLPSRVELALARGAILKLAPGDVSSPGRVILEDPTGAAFGLVGLG